MISDAFAVKIQHLNSESLVDFVFSKAKTMLMQFKVAFPPTALVLSKSGDLGVFPLHEFMNDETSKKAVAAALREVAKSPEVASILVHFECWYLCFPKEETQGMTLEEAHEKLPKPSISPQRQEGIVIICEHRDRPNETLVAKIIRDKDGKCIDLVRESEQKTGVESTGTFTKFFEKKND